MLIAIVNLLNVYLYLIFLDDYLYCDMKFIFIMILLDVYL